MRFNYLARDAFVERMIALLLWCSSVRLSRTSVYCRGFKFTVTPSRLFLVPPRREVGYGSWMCKLGLDVNINIDK